MGKKSLIHMLRAMYSGFTSAQSDIKFKFRSPMDRIASKGHDIAGFRKRRIVFVGSFVGPSTSKLTINFCVKSMRSIGFEDHTLGFGATKIATDALHRMETNRTRIADNSGTLMNSKGASSVQ